MDFSNLSDRLISASVVIENLKSFQSLKVLIIPQRVQKYVCLMENKTNHTYHSYFTSLHFYYCAYLGAL